jgi:cytochrome c oxidase subunit 3
MIPTFFQDLGLVQNEVKMVPNRKYLIHPQYIILTLIIAGISALFLGFSMAYMYHRIERGVPPVQIPTLFYFNSLLILSTSLVMIYAQKMYAQDETMRFRSSVWMVLALTLVFLGMQVFAWEQLQQANTFLTSSTMASYIYLISGLHFLHLVAGIPFLAFFLYNMHLRMRDPVTVLMYFADPDRKRTLHLLAIYWHFLDGLWLYLVIFFLLNYLF